VVDLQRAIKFYSAVLGKEVALHDMPGMPLGVFPHEPGGTGACLFHDPARPPAAEGPLIYLNAEGRLDAAEPAIAANGGKVLQSKHAIGPYGFRIVFLDSEGNRLALHSK
jgi:predicted enzyme related to lactoylglutathione lyase